MRENVTLGTVNYKSWQNRYEEKFNNNNNNNMVIYIALNTKK